MDPKLAADLFTTLFPLGHTLSLFSKRETRQNMHCWSKRDVLLRDLLYPCEGIGQNFEVRTSCGLLNLQGSDYLIMVLIIDI